MHTFLLLDRREWAFFQYFCNSEKSQGAVTHTQSSSLINLLQMRKLMFCLGGMLSQTLPGEPSIVSVQVFLGLVDSTEAGCAWHRVCLGFACGCDGA